LVSCGIDSERIGRFERWASSGAGFMPFVFTKKERSRCARLDHPAAGLCAAFCVKEALFKALGRPYNFTDCEFLLGRGKAKSSFSVSRRLAREFRGFLPVAKILRPVSGHITAVVYLLGIV
jgi:phosphopantetheinyl transferase (holo-ACP synthase)